MDIIEIIQEISQDLYKFHVIDFKSKHIDR